MHSLPELPVDANIVIKNVTTSPARVLDPNVEADASLYSLDLWPVSQVKVAIAAGA